MSNPSFNTQLIQLNAKTAGKDKIYRTIQYGCKMFWYILWKNKTNKDYLEILKKIESSMSNTRKVLRLAKSHEMIEAALKAIHIDDDFLRYIMTSYYINQACYLVMDNLLWLNSVGVLNMKKNKLDKISEWSNKFWLFTTLLYLARDINDLINLIKYEQETSKKKSFNPANKYIFNESSGAYESTSNLMESNKAQISNRRKTILAILICIMKKSKRILTNKNNHPLLLDFTKNIFDIFLPLSNANYINISPGMQGFCGLMSSLISLFVIWNSKYKLSP